MGTAQAGTAPETVEHRFRVVPASYVYLLRAPEGETQVLLQLRLGTGYLDGHWACAAAGHVEIGESAMTAGCREAAEELGISIVPGDLVPVTAMHRTAGSGHPLDERVDFFFTCSRWTGEPHILEPEKSAALEWFPLGALPEPTVPHEHHVLTALAAAASTAAGITATGTTAPLPAITAYGFPPAAPRS